MISDYIQKIEANPELWDHYTRKEEYGSEYRDQYDRFPYFLSKTKDIFQPNVSKFLTESGFHPEYPEGKNFAVCLTHDIDIINMSVLMKCFYGLKALHKKDTNEMWRQLSHIYSKKIPYNNFQKIIELETEYGAKSSFYFLALDRSQQGFNYSLEEVESEIGFILDAGWEIGLHGSHEAYCDFEQICTEKARIEKVTGTAVVGYRNHYLRFRVPETWEYLSKAGFLYDTTLGYADCAGFRNGMCHPFRPYNLNTNSYIDILEIPLIVMDGTLFSTYMRLNPDVAFKCVKSLIDQVEECQGVFTLLWHNTMLQEGTMEAKLYKKILEYCSEKNAWMTSALEIVKNNGEDIC